MRVGLPMLALLVSACDPTVLKFSVSGPARQVLVVPGEFYVTVSKSKLLAAVVEGDEANAVNWIVDDPNGGSILPNGEYQAPDIIGVFRVLARSRVDSQGVGEGYANVVGVPSSPELETDHAIVTLGDATLKARVKNPEPGMIYEWTVQNGTLLSTPKANEIEFRADQLGFIALVCHVENPAGDTTRPGQLFIDVVEPLPDSYLPDVLVPSSVRTNRQHLRAIVQNPQVDLMYTWTLQNGIVNAGQGGATLEFTAGDTGTMHLEVFASTAAGVSTPPAALDIEVVAGGDATVIGGVAGGAGLASGSSETARFAFPSHLRADADDNVYVLSADDDFNYARGTLAGISRVWPDGHVTLLGGEHALNDPRALAVDSQGDVFVIDVTADDYDVRLVKIHRDAGPTGVFEELSILSEDSRFNSVHALAVDADDYLYLATSTAIYILPPGGEGVPERFIGDPPDDGTYGCVDGDETLALFNDITDFTISSTTPFVMYIADHDNNRVRRVDATFGPLAATVTTPYGPNCADTVSNAIFHDLGGVAVAANGDVYISDAYYGYLPTPDTVWVVSHTAPTIVRHLAGPAAYSDTDPFWRNGTGETALFDEIRNIALLSNGDLVVADSSNQQLRRISNIDATAANPAATAQVGTFAGKTAPYQAFLYQPSTFCPVDQRDGLVGLGPVTVDQRGRVLVADNGNCRFRMFDQGNRTDFAGNGVDGYYGIYNGLPYYSQQSKDISDVAVESDGSFVFTENVFNSDSSTFYRQVRRITPDGLTTSVAGGYIGTSACAFPATYVDDRGSAARFCNLSGIAVDPDDGTLYAVDADIGTSVRAILPDTTVVTVGYFFESSIHKLKLARGLEVGAMGDLFYVNAAQNSEPYGWHIEKTAYSPYEPPARVTVAGSPATTGALDGACLSARFLWPTGLAYDRDTDTMYVADYNLVRRVRNISTPATCIVDTIAGVPGERGFVAGGLPARFNRVRDVALTPAKDLVVTDDVENVVVLIRL